MVTTFIARLLAKRIGVREEAVSEAAYAFLKPAGSGGWSGAYRDSGKKKPRCRRSDNGAEGRKLY
jgi:hypothetical protein